MSLKTNSLRYRAQEAHVVVVMMVDPYGGEYQFTFDPELIANRPSEVGHILMTSYLAAVRRAGASQPAARPIGREDRVRTP
jgi:hypothetical protein